MIIDIHAHTSNYDLWNLHVRRADIQDLERLAEKYGISKIVLVATYFPFKGRGLPNGELLERIRDKRLFSMFGSLDAMNNFAEGIKELGELAKTQLISGIKLYPGYQNFDFGSNEAYPIYELAARYHLPVMFHSGELHHCCPKEQIARGEYKCKNNFCYIEKLGHLARPKVLLPAIRQFSEVKFVLSHLGNPYFDETREVLSLCSNAYTDISGQLVSGSEEDNPEYRKEVKGELEKFLMLPSGIDRILFASDFPIQSYEYSIELVKSLGLGHEGEEKIFSSNAMKILKLKEET